MQLADTVRIMYNGEAWSSTDNKVRSDENENQFSCFYFVITMSLILLTFLF